MPVQAVGRKQVCVMVSPLSALHGSGPFPTDSIPIPRLFRINLVFSEKWRPFYRISRQLMK
jgi:hypothetical protein